MALWRSIHLQCRRCRRCGLVSCVSKVPFRRSWQPTSACLPKIGHGQVQSIGSQRVRHEHYETNSQIKYKYFKGKTGFLCGSAGKESACNVGNLGSIPGLGRYPGEEKSCPLQYSGLENSMDYPRGRKESDMTERLSH